MSSLYIGLMSGTSLDGVDAVLIDFASLPATPLQVLAHAHQPYPSALREELLALNAQGENELHRAAVAANAVSRSYAEVVFTVLRDSRLRVDAVQALGAHGQTVRHQPGEFDHTGYSLQLLNGALLSELTGIDVVCDFRSRDIAAGGQGAPLVTAFHRAVFARDTETTAVLNIGGISNLTVLAPGGVTEGFDCGPGNVLMDHWCQRHTGLAYDDRGAWAASGQVVQALLDNMLAEPYFAMLPPKSTGRDLFNPSWLMAQLQRVAIADSLSPQDVQATLAEVTAQICARDVRHRAAHARELLVCGGGALNSYVLSRMAALLPYLQVVTSNVRGLSAQHVEAAAFAWLAYAFCRRLPGNIATATGAKGDRVLGALYPAH